MGENNQDYEKEIYHFLEEGVSTNPTDGRSHRNYRRAYERNREDIKQKYKGRKNPFKK